MFKHILIPTDGSELSEMAVSNGIAFALSIGAKLTVITVSAPFHIVTMDAMMVTPETEERYMKEMEQLAQERLDVIREKSRTAGVGCETLHVFDNHPYDAIIATAQAGGCDLIFMASHGRRGVAALLLGGETHKVLTHCKIPVMVWR
jgi:nucleotide-binding universal stress UspA family protein